VALGKRGEGEDLRVAQSRVKASIQAEGNAQLRGSKGAKSLRCAASLGSSSTRR